MIRCIVFDFDGVLVDSNAIKRDLFFEVFASVAGADRVIEKSLEDCADGDRYEIISNIAANLKEKGLLDTVMKSEQIAEEYVERYNSKCEESIANCPKMPGVTAGLSGLVGRFALYINSSTPENELNKIICRREWEGYFTGIFGRPCTKVENLKKIATSEHIARNEILFVGDNQRDLDAAIQFGCHFVGMLSNSSQFTSELSSSLRNLSELGNITDAINRKCRMAI